MSRRSMLRSAVCAAALSLFASLAPAQSFAGKPITLIVVVPPGGIVDLTARIAAEHMARALGTSVVVDNRGGGNGTVAYSAVQRAPADGHTLLVTYSTYHVGNPALIKKLPWAQKDFVPVAMLTAATNVITVHPSVPANTLQEFLTYVKANPGKLSYADNGGMGSPAHIGTEMIKEMTGTNIVHIPYRGSGQAIQGVLANQVQMFMTSPPSVLQHVQGGKLKALAVTGPKRHPSFPTVPTTAEAGLKFELESWVAIFAAAGTPPEIVNALSAGIKQAMETPEARQRIEGAGAEVRYLPPAEVDAVVRRETPQWATIINKLKISLD